MTHRALEILDLRSPSLVLDIGCGSGLSGEILSSIPPEEGGPHQWIGLDVSPSMLEIALQRDVEGDLMHADMGQGIPFAPGTFDAAISISAIQWLCSAESSDTSPIGRLNRFFEGLYASVKRGGRAVCQFYPKNDIQKQMITQSAIKAGFGAGILEDDGGTKNEKLYLVLTVGKISMVDKNGAAGDITNVVDGLEGVDIQEGRNAMMKAKRGVLRKTRKDQITKWKARAEKRGKVVKAASKYTGRKRRTQF